VQAKQEVAQFELLVERTLYAYLVKQIDVAWEKGLKYHVLGYENSPFTFYPCISFFCGDDPCQHRISGLQEGNAKHGCVYCMFPTTSGSIYSPNVHRPRDAVELSQLCAVAEDVTVVCMASVVRVPLSVEQKRVLKTLKFRNVHPHTNPFHFANMGYNNDIYKANPPDLLHLFCAGLMKSLTQWTLTIILEINSKCK